MDKIKYTGPLVERIKQWWAYRRLRKSGLNVEGASMYSGTIDRETGKCKTLYAHFPSGRTLDIHNGE